jgi:hypothetical protein
MLVARSNPSIIGLASQSACHRKMRSHARLSPRCLVNYTTRLECRSRKRIGNLEIPAVKAPTINWTDKAILVPDLGNSGYPAALRTQIEQWRASRLPGSRAVPQRTLQSRKFHFLGGGIAAQLQSADYLRS